LLGLCPTGEHGRSPCLALRRLRVADRQPEAVHAQQVTDVFGRGLHEQASGREVADHDRQAVGGGVSGRTVVGQAGCTPRPEVCRSAGGTPASSSTDSNRSTPSEAARSAAPTASALASTAIAMGT
jgi:K+-transporting ATPase c subunit